MWEVQYFARDLAPEETSERISKVEDFIMFLEQTSQLTGAPNDNIVKRIVNALGFWHLGFKRNNIHLRTAGYEHQKLQTHCITDFYNIKLYVSSASTFMFGSDR